MAAQQRRPRQEDVAIWDEPPPHMYLRKLTADQLSTIHPQWMINIWHHQLDQYARHPLAKIYNKTIRDRKDMYLVLGNTIYENGKMMNQYMIVPKEYFFNENPTKQAYYFGFYSIRYIRPISNKNVSEYTNVE